MDLHNRIGFQVLIRNAPLGHLRGKALLARHRMDWWCSIAPALAPVCHGKYAGRTGKGAAPSELRPFCFSAVHEVAISATFAAHCSKSDFSSLRMDVANSVGKAIFVRGSGCKEPTHHRTRPRQQIGKDDRMEEIYHIMRNSSRVVLMD